MVFREDHGLSHHSLRSLNEERSLPLVAEREKEKTFKLSA